jgi:hypothetical protein
MIDDPKQSCSYVAAKELYEESCTTIQATRHELGPCPKVDIGGWHKYR